MCDTHRHALLVLWQRDYGRDVQDPDDRSITEDVKEKLLMWARAAVAVGQMRGKSYLSVGNVSMGIAGSIVNPDLLEKYFGMRCEYKDMSELIRRVENEIYDPAEYEKALEWAKANCKENADIYNKDEGRTREQKDIDWEWSVKMALIMTHLNWVDGFGPVLQIAEGYSVELPDKCAKTLEDRTDPGWPSTFFVPVLSGAGAFRDVFSVMDKWGANHAASVYGHVGDMYITLASMLRIPVNMHNVAEERIYRPSAWNELGTCDMESSDYRACGHFGPLYK